MKLKGLILWCESQARYRASNHNSNCCLHNFTKDVHKQDSLSPEDNYLIAISDAGDVSDVNGNNANHFRDQVITMHFCALPQLLVFFYDSIHF